MERHGLASTDLMWPHTNNSGTDESDDEVDSDDTSDPDDDDSEMGEAGEDGAMEVSGNESEDEDESDSESDIQQARASSATTSESDAEESDDESELDQPGEDVQMREFGIEDYDSESSDSDDSSCEDSDSEESDSEDFDSKDSDIEENTGEDADTSQPVAKRAQDGEVNNLQGPTGSKRKRPQSKNPEGKEPQKNDLQKNDLQKQTKNDEAATAEVSNRAFDTSHYTNFTATNATVCVESPTGPWYEITSPVRCTCCGQKKGTPGSVVIATDGSCLNMLNKNEAGIIPSPAACSIFFHPESKLNYSWMLPGEVETSLRAEYTGALMALRIALNIRRCNPNLTDEQLLARGNVGPETKLRQVLIKTDNETLVLAMTRKMKRKSGSGKPVRDADLLIAIDKEIEALNTSGVRVGFLWVSRTENTHADALAKKKLKDVGAKALMKKQSQKKKTGKGKGKGEKNSKKEEKEEKKRGGKKRVRTKRGKKTNPTNKTKPAKNTNPTNKTKPEKKGKSATKKPGKSQRKKQKTA